MYEPVTNTLPVKSVATPVAEQGFTLAMFAAHNTSPADEYLATKPFEDVLLSGSDALLAPLELYSIRSYR